MKPFSAAAIIALLLWRQEGLALAKERDLDLPPLKPGEVMSLMYADTHDELAPYAARVGLPPGLRDSLLDYCNRMGITDKYLELMSSKPLSTGHENNVQKWADSQGHSWAIVRPAKHWHSNMHWMEPYDPVTQHSMLTALGDAGFDEVFNGVGEFFELDTLTAHSISFVAVTYATQESYLHHDFTNTGGKGFNIIVPLLVVDGSPLELEVGDDEDGTLYGLKYNYTTGVVVGDDTMHRTSAVDYRDRPGQMRMAATIYCGDINEDNVDQFLMEYTPTTPELDDDALLARRGLHWGDGASLPKTDSSTVEL